jgi:hypothetical protein
MRKDEGPLDLEEAYKVLVSTLTLARADLRQLEKLVEAEAGLSQTTPETQQWFWSHLFHNLQDLCALRTACLFDQDSWHHVGSVQAILDYVHPSVKRRRWWQQIVRWLRRRPEPAPPVLPAPKKAPARIVPRPGEEFWPAFARYYRRRLGDQSFSEARRRIREARDRYLAHREVRPAPVSWSLESIRRVQAFAEEFAEDFGEALLGIANPTFFRDWGNGSAAQLQRLLERTGIKAEPWWRKS